MSTADDNARQRIRFFLRVIGEVKQAQADAQSRARRYYLTGLLLLFAAAMLWSLNGALIKLIYRDGAGPHPVVIAFYRSLFAGLILLPLAKGKFRSLKAEAGSPSHFGINPAATCCVVFFTLMTVSFVVANTKTEAANAIILQYTSTFWVFGLSPWLLKESPRSSDKWILALAIVGIGTIFLGNAATDLVGLVIALGSGLFFALLTLMIRRMRHADSAAVTVFNNLGSALLILPLLFWFGGFSVTPREGVLLVVMGVVQFGVPYYLFSLGLVRVPAYQAALIITIEPVLNPVWTYLAVGEQVPVWTAVGGGIILLALVIFVWRARRGTSPLADNVERREPDC